jgi:ABC-type Mn2+/Zn2+ transport system permease subunit
MANSVFGALLVSAILVAPSEAAYQLQRTYAGSTFASGFNFRVVRYICPGIRKT